MHVIKQVITRVGFGFVGTYGIISFLMCVMSYTSPGLYKNFLVENIYYPGSITLILSGIIGTLHNKFIPIKIPIRLFGIGIGIGLHVFTYGVLYKCGYFKK